MTQALYLGILQDGVMKQLNGIVSTFLCVVSQHDNDP